MRCFAVIGMCVYAYILEARSIFNMEISDNDNIHETFWRHRQPQASAKQKKKTKQNMKSNKLKDRSKKCSGNILDAISI